MIMITMFVKLFTISETDDCFTLSVLFRILVIIVLVHLFRCCLCFYLHPIWKLLGRRCPEQGKFGAATWSGETPKTNNKLTFEWDLDVDLQVDLNSYSD